MRERMQRRHPDVVIRLIALFKLVKALMLIALGVGALSMRHHDDGSLATWIHALAADPHGKYVNELLAKITSFDAHDLRQIGIGSLIYAVVFLVEGVGLMLRKMWAEVMTVIVTTSFIPLEVYELTRRFTPVRLGALVANVVIVAYLVARRWQARREAHGHH